MRRVGSLVLGALLGLLAVLALAAPAQGHDYLVSSTPNSGASVSTPPQQVSLEFNTAIGQQFAQVAVVGPDGTTYQDGPPLVDGPSVTQAVSGLPDDIDVTISYRVVSSDGHPIGGTVPFTVAAAAQDDSSAAAPTSEQPSPPATPDAEPPADSATSDEPQVSAEPTAEAATTPAALTSESNSGGVPTWGLVAGAALLAGVIGVGIAVARRTSTASSRS